ncbi:unnamed protein product, partial [Laminaria digitata]
KTPLRLVPYGGSRANVDAAANANADAIAATDRGTIDRAKTDRGGSAGGGGVGGGGIGGGGGRGGSDVGGSGGGEVPRNDGGTGVSVPGPELNSLPRGSQQQPPAQQLQQQIPPGGKEWKNEPEQRDMSREVNQPGNLGTEKKTELQRPEGHGQGQGMPGFG